MRLGARTLALLVPLLAGPWAPGCAARRGATVEAPKPPQRVADLDHFYVVLNEFALLDASSPQREEFRKVLLDYLIRHIDESLGSDDETEALEALQYAVALFRPSELRAGRTQPALARTARRVYRTAARRGAERPAMLALAVEQQFGAAEVRATALSRWREIEDWVMRNSEYAREPLMRYAELQESLEEIAAVFPSPFVTERLADLYMAHYEAARNAYRKGSKFGPEARMIEVTGYLLLRLYLRADDMAGAIAAVEAVEQQLPVRKLAQMVSDARKPARSARPLLALADQFLPDRRNAIPIFDTQGWGIVHNLAERAVAADPNDPFAHHLLAQSLTQRGLYDAAIVHLERTLAARDDIYEIWAELADLHQRSLIHQSAMDPVAARATLTKLEKFHAGAVEKWRERPIEPGLPLAYYTVAEGLYSVGRVDDAHALLERSLEIEAAAPTLDLLGTIELKRGQLDRARKRFELIVSMSFDTRVDRLRWEIKARTALGTIARAHGDMSGAFEQLQHALERSDILLTRPELDDDERSQAIVEHGKLRFYLGDVDGAWGDFREAAHVAPDNGDAYATPLLCAVSHGYYDDAREIYERAMGSKHLRDGLKLYFTLWLDELGRRQGLDRDARVTAFLRDYDGDPWEEKLARHARGQLGFDALLGSADDVGQRAEAYFYEGLRKWRGGDKAGAKQLMRKVVATGMMSFFEYEMAQSYLEWNDIPRTARAPTTPPPRGTARAQ